MWQKYFKFTIHDCIIVIFFFSSEFYKEENMAGSNNPIDLFKMLCGQATMNQINFIQNMLGIIIVHDDPILLNRFKILISNNSSSGYRKHVFDSVKACSDFLRRISDNHQLKLIVFTGGQLVCDLVSSIHENEQVEVILNLNKPPFSQEERDIMECFSKVRPL